MGNSKSSTKLTVVNNTVNKNTINNINKDIINMGVETLIKMNQSCSSTITQNNTCNIDDLVIKGSSNVVIGGTQTNQARQSLTCTQWSKATTEMNNEMMNTMISKIKTLNGTEAASDVNSTVRSHSANGFASLPIGQSKTDINGNITNDVLNETLITIEDIYETNLKNNFTAENLQSCVVSSAQGNYGDLSGGTIYGGNNIKVGCTQQNSIDQILNCKQLTDAVANSTADTMKKLGFVVDNTGVTENTVKSKTEATSSKVSTGPIQDLTDGIGNVIGSIGGCLSCQNGGCTICIIVICVLLISSSGGFFIMKSQGGGGKKMNGGYIKNSESNILDSDSSFYS